MMLFTVFTLLFIVVSFAMVLIILVQRPQGGGLSTAFGGAGGGNDTAFGGRTGDALTVATVACFFLYLLIAIGLNITDGPRAKPVATPPVADAAPDATLAEPGREGNNSSGTESIPLLPTTPQPIAVPPPVQPDPQPEPAPEPEPEPAPTPEPGS